MDNTIYTRLKEVARDQEIISYTEAGELVGLDMRSPVDRNELSRLLDEINQFEAEYNRPMLSSLVVYANDPQTPGPGFFVCARGLARLSSNDSIDELGFWASEVKTVHEYWGSS